MPAATDQRIIDCFVSGNREQLAELSGDHGGEAAVRARAQALGLTQEFIKRCRLSGTRPALRPCLGCDARFLSSGLGNRLCRRCSGK